MWNKYEILVCLYMQILAACVHNENCKKKFDDFWMLNFVLDLDPRYLKRLDLDPHSFYADPNHSLWCYKS